MDTHTYPHLAAIAAMSENRTIGKNNKLPWHLPADLRHFKQLTLGHPIVMGRKTYQAIGKPLPQRENIILTRDSRFSAPGCVVVREIADVLNLPTENEVFIIGGAEIYQQFLPFISRIYLTIVHAIFEGDAFFPELNMQVWQQVSCEDHHADTENKYDYSFVELNRIPKK